MDTKAAIATCVVLACGCGGHKSFGFPDTGGGDGGGGSSSGGSGSGGGGGSGSSSGGGLLGDASSEPGDSGNGCTGQATDFVYVLSAENDLYSFAPDKKVFTKIGTLGCKTSMQPNSMAVDRNADAYVNYVFNPILFSGQ